VESSASYIGDRGYLSTPRRGAKSSRLYLVLSPSNGSTHCKIQGGKIGNPPGGAHQLNHPHLTLSKQHEQHTNIHEAELGTGDQ
jgi:hypothetical protein